MDIKIEQPSYLLLAIPAILLLIWWWKTQKRSRGKRKYLILILRFFFFVSVILSLSHLVLLFPMDGETVLFVVDRSASIQDQDKARTFLKEAIKEKGEQDQYGIISVGERAQIEQPLTIKQTLPSLETIVNPHATNLAEGIRLAAALIPEHRNGKIVLITDGLETEGDLLTETKIATDRGILINVYPITNKIQEEVLISSFSLPDDVHLHQVIQGTVVLKSTTNTTGTLRFYEGNQALGSQEVLIERGDNRFIFHQPAKQTGFHKYRVELTTDKDTILVNNQAYAYTQVKSNPKVLVIEGHQGAAENLLHAFASANIDYDLLDIHLLPKELEDYKQYATIVLSDVQAMQFSVQDMERIRTAVRDLGIGLIMTGGKDSYGLGGWFKTPIEEALPVYMDLRNKEKLPSLGLILVIDKSGSMAAGMDGLNKMELAKEAALRATDMLNGKDQIGVIAFDGQPWTVVEPTSAKNLSDIQEKISGIYADGGTNIYPALESAFNQIKDLKTQRKHIILLTDGNSGGNSGYNLLLEEMKKFNITVSTVAIGSDADRYLLQDIANKGKGRYYFSNDPSTIPKIFSKETALASRTFIVNKPHIPKKITSGGWSALQGSVPALQAYIATTPKQTAENLLISMDHDPILTRWQYGLGRSVAWTSDVEGRWSGDWVTWNDFNRLWSEIIDWTIPRVKEGDWIVETSVEGTNGVIHLKTKDRKIPKQITAIVVNEKLEREEVDFNPVAPGQLQASFPIQEEGNYMIQLIEKNGKEIIAKQTEGFSVSYSPEYRIINDGLDKLQKVIQINEGKFITQPKEAFSDHPTISWKQHDTSNFWLILATILWPIDIGIRKLNISFAFLETLIHRLRRNKQEKELRKEESVFNHLITKKKQKNKERSQDGLNQVNSVHSEKKADKKSNQINKTKTVKSNQNETLNRLLEAKNKNKNKFK